MIRPPSRRLFANHPVLHLLLTTALLAATSSAQLAQSRFEHISFDQGMSGRIVPCLLQDSQGFVWLGTWGGLDKFDGYTFTTFKYDRQDSTSLGNPFVWALCEDSLKYLWVGTYGGLDRLDRGTGTFAHYKHNARDPFSLAGDTVKALFVDRGGVIWIGTNRGLDRYERATNSFSHFQHTDGDSTGLSDNAINAIYETRDGRLWIGSGTGATGGLDQLDRNTGRFVHYRHDRRDQRTLIHNRVTALCEDRSGRLWVGTDGGLDLFDGAMRTFRHHTSDNGDPQSLSSNNVTSICEDADGLLWIGTWPGGVNAMHTATGKVTRFQHDEKDPGSLSSDWVMSVYYERSGTLWASTFLGGVNKLSRTRPLFTHYTHDDRDPHSLSSNEIYSLAEDAGGMIWIGTTDVLNRFDPQTGSIQRFLPHDKKGNTASLINPICIDRLGSPWIDMPFGLARANLSTGILEYPDKRTVYRDNGVAEELHLIGSDRRGGLFLTGTTGLYHFDPATKDVTEIKRLKQTAIMLLQEGRSGDIWLATPSGVMCYMPIQDSLADFASRVHGPDRRSGTPILTMHEDKTGSLWYGPGGLHRLDRRTGTVTHWSEKDGLPNDAVMAILEDDSGNLWLSTGRGLSKYDPSSNRFRNYDISYGLHGNQFHRGAALRTGTGEMYFGGTGGFTRFHPDSVKDNPFVPPLVITVFKRFDQPERFEKEISLSYEDTFIGFEFAALSYTTPARNRYAYKMEGADKEWVNAGSRRYATYAHLEPGNYLFRVKGSNNDGVWNDAGTSVAVVISPPFWKTWWFMTLFWLTLAGTIGGTVRYVERRKLKQRIRELEQEQAILEERDRTKARIASDLHDDVASTLGGIALYAESLKSGLRDTPIATRNRMDRIITLLDDAQEAVHDIVWSVTPRQDTLEELLWRMRDHAAQLFGENGIAYNLHFPSSVEKCELPDTVRKNIFLIFKEAVNNCIRHAQANSVSVGVTLVAGVFAMVIEDDGVGFCSAGQQEGTSGNAESHDPPARGHGLRNMTQRAEVMGGELSIRSTVGKGTVVRLVVNMT